MGLHIQQIRIAVGITTKGEPKLLYLGRDSAKCDAALADAGTEFSEVGAVPRGTTPQTVRYPAREALNATIRANEAKAREDHAKNARRLEAEKEAVEAKRLAAKSAATLKEISVKSDK